MVGVSNGSGGRGLAAMVIAGVLIACSGAPSGTGPSATATPPATSTPGPTGTESAPPGPTATPTSAPTPVPATPSPTPESGWTNLTDLFMALGLELPDGLPPQPDETGDGTTADGSAQSEISPDLDIVSFIAGWAELPESLYAGDDVLACSHERVLCADDPLPPSDSTAIVAAVRVSADIALGQGRDGQIALAMTRPGFPNTNGGGGFSGADLVLVADLEAGNIFMREWKKGDGFVIAPRRGGESRAVLVGDTVLFIIPNDIGEKPSGRFVTFERVPPTEAGAGRIDVAAAIDSFFDIDYRINFD